MTTTEIDEIKSKSDNATIIGRVFVGGYTAIFGWVNHWKAHQLILILIFVVILALLVGILGYPDPVEHKPLGAHIFLR